LHHDKKIVLLPVSPEAIVRDDTARAAKAKSETNKIVKSVANKQDEIRLKGTCLVATKSDINDLIATTSVAYALVCKDALISIHDMQHSLPLLSLTFCRSILMCFQMQYQWGCHQYEGLSTKLI
jgi:hypothetical protein